MRARECPPLPAAHLRGLGSCVCAALPCPRRRPRPGPGCASGVRGSRRTRRRWRSGTAGSRAQRARTAATTRRCSFVTGGACGPPPARGSAAVIVALILCGELCACMFVHVRARSFIVVVAALQLLEHGCCHSRARAGAAMRTTRTACARSWPASPWGPGTARRASATAALRVRTRGDRVFRRSACVVARCGDEGVLAIERE